MPSTLSATLTASGGVLAFLAAASGCYQCAVQHRGSGSSGSSSSSSDNSSSKHRPDDAKAEQAPQQASPIAAFAPDASQQLPRTISPHPAPEPAPPAPPRADAGRPSGGGGGGSSGYRTCLDRPFVQKEVRWARQHSRPIITVFEDDARRQGHFDYGAVTLARAKSRI